MRFRASPWERRWYKINTIREGKAKSSIIGASASVGGHGREGVMAFVLGLEEGGGFAGADVWEGIPERGHSMDKGVKVGTHQASLGESKAVTMATG